MTHSCPTRRSSDLVVALFHDHAWESGVLPWALASEAFYVGAQGGWVAREQRTTMLTNAGLLPSQTARLRSPVGLLGHARYPAALALPIARTSVVEEKRASELVVLGGSRHS